MEYAEFEKEFKSRHTCGIPFIPYELAYSSDCPKCEPGLNQWKEVCRQLYASGEIYYDGMWYRKATV